MSLRVLFVTTLLITTLMITTLMLAACTARTKNAGPRRDPEVVPPEVALAPLDLPPLRDAAVQHIGASAPSVAASAASAARAAEAPLSRPFKFGFCRPGRMWIYPKAACGADAKPECVPVPPPMLALHCGCDGVTYSLASAPWVHTGYCLDAGAAGL